VVFLKSNNQNIRWSIEKTCRDYPSPPADSLLLLTKQLYTLAGKLDTCCENIVHQMDQSKEYVLTPSDAALLAQHWRAYSTVFSTLKINDPLFTPDIQSLMEPASIEKWQTAFNGSNNKEQHYLLNGLQRLTYTTLSIALKQESAITENFIFSPQFDAVKIGMNTNHKPVAGQPFRAEFYPIWYSNKTDNVTAYIDGRKYNFKDGIANCDTVYRTPGKKKVDVKIEVKNPATGQIETVRKEFEIAVF
jgi:hypothetical protein